MIPVALGTPKGLRIHIGLFGRRNAGKSSLVNRLANQEISIVSDVPGTTTDPVEKACELAPIGPVVFIDTAGVDDDAGSLGAARVRRSKAILEWVDIAVVVGAASGLEQDDIELIHAAQTLKTPCVIALNKADLHRPNQAAVAEAKSLGLPVVLCDAHTGRGIDELRQAVIRIVQTQIDPDRPLAGHLAEAGDTVLLVTPIDTGAPKGRLILPQVQAIRELLDTHAKCFVVQQDRVAEALSELRQDPKFIMTDSQAVLEVARQTPSRIPLTTFSIQLAYAKSDLIALAEGAAALGRLRDGDRVLICESCSHLPQPEDIGRIKIPKWLRKHTGVKLNFEISVGKDFPEDLSPYAVLIQCGGCVVTRRHLLMRLRRAAMQRVPMTNYGLAICYLQGILERVLACHPDALEAYLKASRK